MAWKFAPISPRVAARRAARVISLLQWGEGAEPSRMAKDSADEVVSC